MKDPNQNQQIQNFGDPFLMVIREGETSAEVMERIQRKLRVPDEEFSKVIYPYILLLFIIEWIYPEPSLSVIYPYIITIYYSMYLPRPPSLSLSLSLSLAPCSDATCFWPAEALK